MSISGLSGASFLSGASPVSATALGSTSDQSQPAAEKAQAKAEAAAHAQASLLADVRKKGIYAWAQEQKMAALKEKIRQQVLADKKLDDKTLAAMNPGDRASAESSIADEIARRIKETLQTNLESQAKQATADGKPPKPMIIDISI